MRPASKRRPSSLIIGLSRPSFAAKLLRKAARHCFGAPSTPTVFQSFSLDPPLRFIFAVALLLNQPPAPKVALTSCTIITDLSQVVVGGFGFVSTSALWQTKR